jgi:protein-tyrosine phosphatase
MKHHSKTKKFKSLLNFRDPGGIKASGTGLLKEGVLFRSANPDKLINNDLQQLKSLNIKTVIDLRAPQEIRKGSEYADHAYKLSLPLDFQQTTRERLRPVIYNKDSENIIADISNAIYLEILDASAAVLKQVMEALASPDRIPVLIHCQAGKDRTGIIIALILLSLGVERDLIIRDFMKSNDELLPFFKRQFLVRKILSLGFFPYRNMLFAVQVKQRNIESVLDRIDTHYGGIESLMRNAGITKVMLDKVRENLLSDQSL